MNAIDRRLPLLLSMVAVGALGMIACSGALTGPGSGAGGSTGAGGTTGTGGELGTGGIGPFGSGGGPAACVKPTAGEVPSEHRAAAVACSPSTRAPAPPDGGVPSCTTSADCAAVANSGFSACLNGQCSFDQCLTDADCGANAVCVCASEYYGGNAAYHPNLCVQASCRVDSDCGSGGYCSPTHGTCGVFLGFYCHGPADSCVDATRDCLSCGESACIYSPAVGAFTCGAANVCAG